MTENNLKPIQIIAGQLLLFFYLIQRNRFSTLSRFRLNARFSFNEKQEEVVSMFNIKPDEFKDDFLKLGKEIDLIGSLKYLIDKRFIEAKIHSGPNSIIVAGMNVTGRGIDIIENIERGSNEKKEFQVVFNIKVENNFNVDSLIKAELGGLSIFKQLFGV